MHNLVDVPGDINLAHDRGPIFRLLGNSISSRLETRLLAFNGGQSHFSGGRPLVSGPSDCCTAIDIALLGALKTSSALATPSHRIASSALQLLRPSTPVCFPGCLLCLCPMCWNRRKKGEKEKQEMARETFQPSPPSLPPLIP